MKKAPSEYFNSCLENGIILSADANISAEINSKLPKFDIMCRKLSEELLAKEQINFDEFKNSSPEQRYLNYYKKDRT